MAYESFAYAYDTLNEDADYDTLFSHLHSLLENHDITSGIVADLGCGTGEVSVRLAKAGYDVISVDASCDMLQVLREKSEKENVDILLLCQDIAKLDLYGTINAAVSTFDTFSHLTKEQVENSIEKVALFMESGGVFIFDVNTEYKHKEILSDNVFEIQTKDGYTCIWENTYHKEDGRVEIELSIEDEDGSFVEKITEYHHAPTFLENVLLQNDFHAINVVDGESFAPIKHDTQRFLFSAVKK